MRTSSTASFVQRLLDLSAYCGAERDVLVGHGSLCLLLALRFSDR